MSAPRATTPPQNAQDWQLVFAGGGFRLGVCCNEDAVQSIAYLPPRGKTQAPANLLAAECLRQLRAYFARPRRHAFSLPLAPAPTPHQRRAREVICAIAAGQTLSYGEVAARLKNSSARAVGGACRANPLPLLVPCHRVVAANGLGGFMGAGGEDKLDIKRRLLKLEGFL